MKFYDKLIGKLHLLLVVAVVILAGCNRTQISYSDSKSNVLKLKDEGLKLLNRALYDDAFEIGDSLIKIGNDNPKMTVALIYGNIIKGQASLFNDSIKYSYPSLHEAEMLCLKHENASALASVYNGLGLYSSNIEKDDNEALRYFFLGLDAAKRSGNERLHSLLLSNIAVIYYLNDNPMGMRYAQECYDHGKQTGDEFLKYTGSETLAYSWLLRGDTDQALKYIKEAELIMRSYQINEGATLYYIYGLILRQVGNREDAIDAFRESIKFSYQNIAQDTEVRSSIELAEMMVEDNKIGRAIEVLDSALEISNTSPVKIFRSDLLKSLENTYRLAGRPNKADEFAYIRLAESNIEDVDKNIAIESLRAKYDLERVENEINRQQVELVEKQNTVYILGAIVVIMLSLLAFSIYFYRRKNKLYTAIVKQLTDAAREEDRLRETIRRFEELPRSVVKDEPVQSNEVDPTDDDESDNQPLPSDLYNKLRHELEILLLDKSVYTDNLINKDKIARRLGTNRTYLSRFINEYYKMSFTQLINSLRIKEAIRLLSDSELDVSLKSVSEMVGYNSQSTFYTKFNEETGMTPAAFRNKARK